MSPQGIEAHFQLAFKNFSLAVDLDLPGKGVTALYGRSGSGKTSLLRCIAGLERARGKLSVQGQLWQDDLFFLPTHKRPLAYVFQEANLFEHLTVLNNLKYGIKRMSQPPIAAALEQAIELLGIETLLARKPDKLSGGERQRVAIARALAISPQILLMDEPLAALDLERKKEILPFLERLHQTLEIPLLYVTHSPDEVARLADHLLVLEQGKAIACGPLNETLSRLDLPILLGEDLGVVVSASITELDRRWHLARAEFSGGSLWIRDMSFGLGQSVHLRILARDVSLSLTQQTQSSILNHLQVRIDEIHQGEHAAVQELRLKIGNTFLLARITSHSVYSLNLSVGMSVWAQIKSVAIID